MSQDSEVPTEPQSNIVNSPLALRLGYKRAALSHVKTIEACDWAIFTLKGLITAQPKKEAIYRLVMEDFEAKLEDELDKLTAQWRNAREIDFKIKKGKL